MSDQTLRRAQLHQGMVVPWVWGTARQGPRPHSAHSRMALSNGVKGVLHVACFPWGAFLFWVGIFWSFLGVAGVQTRELEVAVGGGDDATVSRTWLSPTSCCGSCCPLQQGEASPWSILARPNVTRGAMSSAHLQHLAPGGNQPPPSSVEQDREVFAFQASLRPWW